MPSPNAAHNRRQRKRPQDRGWRVVLVALLAVLLALVLASCDQQDNRIRVASKDFTEHLILGELLAQVIEKNGMQVDRAIPYGGTFDNMEALKRGDTDLYAEYTGTALVLLGQPPMSDGDAAYRRVEELYEPLGLQWGKRLGFHNDYELVMRRDRAAELGIETISDLSKIEGDIRFGIDDEFQARPVDGYGPLIRRYGLSATVGLVTEDTAAGKTELYESLLEGDVDVVEGFSTDGQIAEFGLVVLEDDLDFFPTYQPAPLVRAATLERFPALQPALNELAGRLTTERMRQMNAAVELDGQDPANVARRFLAEQDLIDIEAEQLAAEKLMVGVGGLDAPSGQTAEALSAVRKTFRGRQVTPLSTADPMAALLSGEARVAVVGTEAFHELGDGVFPERRPGAEAIAPVGFDMAHILAPADSEAEGLADVARLGVGEAGGGSERTARMVLTSLGLLDSVEIVASDAKGEAAVEAQAQALREGDLDALFLMVSLDHPKLGEVLRGGGLKLLNLEAWQEGNHPVRFPFLRVARIPADTYFGLSEPVDTIGAQVVLAGPARTTDPLGTAGPGSAAIGELLPLSNKNVLALNEALQTGEKLDPAVPSAEVLRPQPKPRPGAVNPSPARSIVNFIVICVAIFLVYLYLRPEPPERRRALARETAPGGTRQTGAGSAAGREGRAVPGRQADV